MKKSMLFVCCVFMLLRTLNATAAAHTPLDGYDTTMDLMLQQHNISSKDSLIDVRVLETLKFFYPHANITVKSLNDPLRKLSIKMAYEAIKASNVMDMVPRPTYSKPGFVWIIKQGIQAAIRKLRYGGNKKERKIYESVRATVALKFKSQFELARMGIE